jgi:predicted signal transduction protein with EAL and GGDEF domain
LTGTAAAGVVDFAKGIVAALEGPVLYEGQPLDVGTSVGIARFPQHGRDAQTLVRNADIAMYVAKRNSAAEALIRWRHPEKGLIHPAHFMTPRVTS